MAKESKTVLARRERVKVILPILKSEYPDARCSLDFRTPLELLVATMLSAQCTDARVNLVTPALFKKYPTARHYASAIQEDLETDIKSTGFYRNKATGLLGMGKALVAEHHGEVPRTMDHLHALPGVGRKTANVVLGNAFGIAVGVTVDTHVTRLANRLKLTSEKVDAVKIERDLIDIVPEPDWTLISHLLIFHGRKVCDARKPKCEHCVLLNHCPSGPVFIEAERKKRK